MPLIEWSDSFSVNIKEIDEQHKKLLKIFNAFDDAIEAEKEQKGIINVLEDLLDYVKTHFAREEELMNQYNYPGYKAHKVLHGELANQVIDLYKKYVNGDQGVLLQISTLLSNWLLEHIAEEDKRYSKYLNSKGIT